MSASDRLRICEGVEIPLAELRWRFSRSGGPGGQHVNRAATRVELLFDLAGSPSLSEEQRARLLGRLRGHLSRHGVLRLVCQTHRSQKQNRQEAIARFVALMRAGLRRPRPRRPTRPTRASRERRLAAKRRRSQLKRLRRFRPDDDS